MNPGHLVGVGRVGWQLDGVGRKKVKDPILACGSKESWAGSRNIHMMASRKN